MVIQLLSLQIGLVQLERIPDIAAIISKDFYDTRQKYVKMPISEVNCARPNKPE